MTADQRDLCGHILAVAAALAAAVGCAAWAERAAQAAGPARRARPPQFSKSVQDTFFPDAREKLIGTRPAATTASEPAAQKSSPAAPAPAPDAAAPAAAGWSRLIAAEVVEDEIKAQQIRLAAVVQNPARFQAEIRQARDSLSLLAVLFGIDAEYDGDIRWHGSAAAVRDSLARAGFQCKEADAASHQEAKARADDLQILIRGGSLSLPGGGKAAWPEVADRPPLMQRLEQAQQQAIGPLTASAAEFERNLDRLTHEAQLVAALGEVIMREGYEFAEDETYLDYAKAMQAEALRVRDAALQKNLAQAQMAAGALGKACNNCHAGYRD